uniref:EGF-like domain-containing protein n=1 Tax=Strongyloides papillosus TaxID=174720 RepID=A0A0N5BXX8_STREA
MVNESLIFESKDRNKYHWRIYNLKKSGFKQIINCLIINQYAPGFLHEYGWALKIEYIDSLQHINIISDEYFNIELHSYKKKIITTSYVAERTIVFGEKSGYREFNSTHPNLYKGDTLIIFDDDKIKSEDIEFLEPISIKKIFHPPPSIKISNDPKVKVNDKNKEWWLVEPQSFPYTFTIKLVYNGTTNYPGFFDYENINVFYLTYSKDNKLKKEVLEEFTKPNRPSKRDIILSEPAIVKINYYCDDCIDGGINVMQNMLIGKNFDFNDKFLPSIGYYYDKLHFNLNCSMSTNGITHLKTILFNNERIEIQSLQRTSDKSKGNFTLINDVVIFKNKNPSGTLNCTYIYPMGEFQTSQMYKSFKDEEMPLITYYRDKLLFKPNCSTNQGNSAILKTILFDKERIEIDDLKGTSNGTKGNFKYNETLVTFMDTNPKGKLSCIYKLTYGEVSRNETYKFFSNESMPFVTYPYDQLPIKPNCFMDQGNSANLKSVLFNNESIEVDDLKNATGATKGNFKIEGKKVVFMGNHPEGKLSCIYKLTHGKYQIIQGYKYFKTTKYPLIRYASDQLPFKANCSINLKENVRLTTIMFNDESIEVGDLESTSDGIKRNFKLEGGFVYFIDSNPKGTWICVYKLYVGEIKTFQEYEPIESTTLPDVRYAYGQLNFNPNCSRKKDDSTQLKAIVHTNKWIEVEGLDDAALNQMENLKSTRKFLFYTAKNPKGKFICIYKFPIGKIEWSQNYKPILNETLPVVYSFNELGYKANCSVNLNNYTNLKHISFKDDKIEFRFLKLRKFQERGRLKLEKDFVINTENNPNGTLHCLYDVPIGEVLVKKEFKTTRIDNGQISTNKIGVMGSMILAFVIVINIMILVI